MNTGEIGITAALVAGAVSFLSPCVLPLVPGYLSFVAGGASDAPSSGDVRRRLRSLALCALFVLGFTTVFVILGASASSLSGVLLRYKTEANLIAGVIVVGFGLLMLGAGRWVPWMQRDFRFRVERMASRPGTAFVLGLAFAFGWTPCIGPILGGILTLSATQSEAGAGVRLLLAYSVGLGLPFIAVAFFVDTALARLRRLRNFGRRLHAVAGGIMVVVGLAMLTGQLSAMAYWLLSTFPILGRIG
ncbi:MAG: cytochrome c biogenesis protein CcdA [Casimicrobiaceae bacterium]